MKNLTRIFQCVVLAIPLSTLIANVTAQQLSFNDFELITGNDLQPGASYRFYQVTPGVDAIITVNTLSNATLARIDDSPITTNTLDDSAWRPIVSGFSTSGPELHYVDFDIQFYGNGGNQPVGLSSLTMEIYDTDGDNDRRDFLDGEDGDIVEFAQVAGFSQLISAGSHLETTNYPDGSTLVTAKDSTENPGTTNAAEWLSVWSINNKQGFSVRFGWAGSDNVDNADNDRLYGAYFVGDQPTIVTIPEPSSTLMTLIAITPLLLRRKR